MSIFVSLSAEQLAELRYAITLNDPDLPLERLRIIELSAQGKNVPTIASEVNLHPINVRKWIHRYQQHGIDGLRDGKSPGRPPTFDAAKRAEIAKIYQTPPSALHLNFRQWSIKRLKVYVVSREIVESISTETLRQVVRGI